MTWILGFLFDFSDWNYEVFGRIGLLVLFYGILLQTPKTRADYRGHLVVIAVALLLFLVTDGIADLLIGICIAGAIGYVAYLAYEAFKPTTAQMQSASGSEQNPLGLENLKLRVRLKDGRIGTIDQQDFDPDRMERL